MIISPKVDAAVRLFASIFDGTLIWYQGAWRRIRVP